MVLALLSVTVHGKSDSKDQHAMTAVIVHNRGGPESLHIQQSPLPQPGFEEVRVRIVYAGVNFIDIYFREGLYLSLFPYTPGIEGSGIVESTGPGAEVWIGRRVAFVHKGAGAYAEYAVIPMSRLIPLGNEVDLKQAAAVLLQGLTAQYLIADTARLKVNDTVLVHAAAGGTGRLVTQVAKLKDLRVIGTVSTETKADVARTAGADHVIVGKYESDFCSEVRQLTGGKGIAAVFDGIGTATFLHGFSCLQRRGMMVLYGAASGAPKSVDIATLAQGSVSLIRPTLFDFVSDDAELSTRAAEVLKWVASRKLSLEIKVVPLLDVAEAHRSLAARETTGKLLLQVNNAIEQSQLEL